MNTTRLIFLAAGAILVVPTIISAVALENDEEESISKIHNPRLYSPKELIVDTPTGSVKGLTIESDISNFYAFFSIPYAKAPVDELRFKTAEPIGSWEGVHDGTIEGPACSQRASYECSEDCLTMTVYTSDLNASRPVFVWIHGGALIRGHAGMDEYGPHYFMRHDFVLISVQFRLGIFGFLNLDSEEAPGNMGLADVIEALKWIRHNIASFGGDPDQVTIGGLSSGGIMTHSLLLSPLAQGLFHKVIIQSGTALSYRFYQTDIGPSIQKTKDVLNMANSTNVELLAHLRTLDPLELVDLHFSIGSFYPTGFATYHPYTISKDYVGIIPEDPLVLMLKNNYQHLPMFIGFTSDEGIRLEDSMDQLDFVNDNFEMVVPWDLRPIDDRSFEKSEKARLIKEFYFGAGDLSADTFPEYIKLCTDSWYGHITDFIIRLQGSLQYDASIYYYIFAVDGAYNHQKVVNNYLSPGASHGDDMGYMWKSVVLENVVATDSFSDLSRESYVAMLSNFIISGNPTPEVNKLTPVTWEPVDYPSVKYMMINESLAMQEDPRRERLLFWQRLYNVTEEL